MVFKVPYCGVNLIFRGVTIYLFLFFACITAKASPMVQINGDHESCLGTWISNQGHLLTNLECLNSCINRHYGNCTLQLDKISTTIKIEFLGKGTKNFSTGELIQKTPQELMYYKSSKAFQGDGDFAIVKAINKKESNSCTPLNAQKIFEDEVLLIGQSADRVLVKKPFESAQVHPHYEMLKNIWSWIMRNPKQYIVFLYSTPYSLILSKPNHKYTYGGPVYTMQNKFVGPIVNFENEAGFMKVLRVDKIFEQVTELLGYNQALEYFNCPLMEI